MKSSLRGTIDPIQRSVEKIQRDLKDIEETKEANTS